MDEVQQVRERADGECESCGSTEDLQVCSLSPKLGDEELDASGDMELLCDSCREIYYGDTFPSVESESYGERIQRLKQYIRNNRLVFGLIAYISGASYSILPLFVAYSLYKTFYIGDFGFSLEHADPIPTILMVFTLLFFGSVLRYRESINFTRENIGVRGAIKSGKAAIYVVAVPIFIHASQGIAGKWSFLPQQRTLEIFDTLLAVTVPLASITLAFLAVMTILSIMGALVHVPEDNRKHRV